MNLNDSRVRDVMSTPLATISPDASLKEAAETMRKNDLSALVVTTGPPSIVTRSDIVGAVADSADLTDRIVRDVMTESVETVPPDCPLGEAIAMMTNFDIEHLPVAADDYLGMVSMSDITGRLI
ncbi:MAG: CBS domain-containing protein [Natronomonas sp.]